MMKMWIPRGILFVLFICFCFLLDIIEGLNCIPCYFLTPFFTDQFSTKRFRCLKKTNPLILGAIKKSNQYQEYDLAVSGHSLKETKEILKKMCDNHEQITQGRVSQTIVTLSQIQKLGLSATFSDSF